MSEEKNVIVTTVECPACGHKIEIERPAPMRRGVLVGIELSDMTLEQLRREKINASSVLYKATKRNAPAELIAENQARVDAVLAEINARFPDAGLVRTAKPATEATAEEAQTDETVYNEEVAGEV